MADDLTPRQLERIEFYRDEISGAQANIRYEYRILASAQYNIKKEEHNIEVYEKAIARIIDVTTPFAISNRD